MAEQNQLSRVSDATKALGVTSSLPPNKAITVSELDSLISQLPHTAAKILEKLSLSSNNITGQVFVMNTTSEKIRIYPSEYPNGEVNVYPNSYQGTNIRQGKSLEISRDAFVVYSDSAGAIRAQQVVSHGSIYSPKNFCVIIYWWRL